MRKPHKSHTRNSGTPTTVPQLSYDCRRKIYRAQEFAYWLSVNCSRSRLEPAPHLTHALSYIHDDIEDIDDELISLGLFDEAMGKRPRKPDADAN